MIYIFYSVIDTYASQLMHLQTSTNHFTQSSIHSILFVVMIIDRGSVSDMSIRFTQCKELFTNIFLYIFTTLILIAPNTSERNEAEKTICTAELNL